VSVVGIEPLELLGDRYRLRDRLAVGGMGEVWRADDLLLGRVVAVKLLKPELLDDEEVRSRFRAEARHAGRLAHPGIAAVFDFGEEPDCAWLVMELVEGEPLSRVLRREGALPVARVLDLLGQTAAALQAAHDAGVVHRDVKPGNLLVTPQGSVKVTDFGIASAGDAAAITETDCIVGTAHYLSPEQAAGRVGSAASDLYALGVVAYECLTGARPFAATNPVAVALAHLQEQPRPLPAQVPAPVRQLVRDLLAKDPEDRPASAGEVARRAAELRDGADEVAPTARLMLPDVPAAPTAPLASLPGTRARSSRRVVRLVAACLGGLALGGVLLVAPDQTAAPAVAAPAVRDEVRAPTAVFLDPDRFRGKRAAQVRATLARLGLVPRLAYDGSGTPVGTVSAVQPSGRVTPGGEVLVHVVPVPPPAVAPPPPQPAPDPGPPGGKPGRGKAKGKGRR
jgi:tRNA A-37 threonylcarbamoyl transferase component Bud32